TVKKLPTNWGGDPVAEEIKLEDDMVHAVFPVNSMGKGQAQLEIAATITNPLWNLWQLQAGLGGIGAASMIVVLMMYRGVRRRLLPMGRIREALLAYQGGETTCGGLSLPSDSSSEAQAWNRLLSEREQLASKAHSEKV